MQLTSGVTSLDIALGVASLLFVVLLFTRSRIPKGLCLPPGPRGRFITGNAADIPKHHEWETYTRWGKEYGNLIYIKVFQQSMVFINSLDIANDLFEKRSSLYSDRYHFTMLRELMGHSWSFALMPYGEQWRRHRRAFHQSFHSHAATAYYDIQTKHSRQLVRRLHESPEEFMEHIRYLAGATIVEITYGIKLLPKDDPYIKIAEQAMAATGKAANPGSFLVDTLPFLKYVPEWFPGAGFQRKAREWRVPMTQVNEVPFEAVKRAMSEGTAVPSITASLLEDLAHRTDAPADQETIIRNNATAAYAAGADTTVAALSGFVVAMILYPGVQRKAQAELDSVIGMDRLPTFEDRQNLPYVNALCNEVLRWHPVAPLGVAHGVTKDDVYDKYFIPGGSIVVGNSWMILHDEKRYGPQPDEFRPERFFEPRVEYPTPAFGYGRRICPGRYLADNSIFIAIASILKVFDISNTKDGHGNDIAFEPAWTSGMISFPEPFKCEIKLRSPSAKDLIYTDE